ncbi:unnamed protein product [Mytilus coruscus]|uniref:Integrase catalytic domain-containing protein n=1 Tax=Mytilus coruscus TaxID=42192 RepID=A0A6J8B2G1_MYTCO|nr:unnamed protein product [Mytilus coruscus]
MHPLYTTRNKKSNAEEEPSCYLCTVKTAEPDSTIREEIEVESTEQGVNWTQIITKYFSRWAESYPMPDQEAETVTRIFGGEFIARFGLPRQVYTDQRRQFEYHLFQSLCQTFKIDKTRTTALHPQSDGMVERLNRTIDDILSKFIAKDQRDWDLHLPLAMMAYRSSIHAITGYSPSMLMFGREIELPVDLLYGQPPQISDNITHQYLAQLINNCSENGLARI